MSDTLPVPSITTVATDAIQVPAQVAAQLSEASTSIASDATDLAVVSAKLDTVSLALAELSETIDKFIAETTKASTAIKGEVATAEVKVVGVFTKIKALFIK